MLKWEAGSRPQGSRSEPIKNKGRKACFVAELRDASLSACCFVDTRPNIDQSALYSPFAAHSHSPSPWPTHRLHDLCDERHRGRRWWSRRTTRMSKTRCPTSNSTTIRTMKTISLRHPRARNRQGGRHKAMRLHDEGHRRDGGQLQMKMSEHQ